MSLLSVTPAEGIIVTEDDLSAIAKKYGYEFKDNEKAEFTTLLAATCNAMQFVSEMDDYQPEPDFTMTPRENIYFPTKEDNLDNAWAYRFDLWHKSPPSTLLKDKTVCIKDNICVAGVPCLIGTDVMSGWIPKTDATIVTRILDAGGVIKGKAVCENLSTSAASFTAATGPVDNPYARGYSAGGSSSGTANLVAKGEVDLGIGADQGGSIRIPASLCGLVGFKATSGLVPYTGCVSSEATIDYVGPITRTVMDNAMLLEAIAGVDGLDDRQRAGTPFLDQVPRYSQILLDTKDSGIKGLRIGVLKEGLSSKIMDAGVESKFRAAVKVLEDLGAAVREASIPMHDIAPAIFGATSKQGGVMGRTGRASGRRQVMLPDLYEKMLPTTAESIEKMSVVSKNALFAGEFCWQKFPHVYAKSINLCRKLTETYDEALKNFDVLIMPTTITPADPLPLPTDSAVTKMSKTIGKLDNTCPFNATGHPALAIPIGFVPSKADASIKVPASMQIVGKHWNEVTCLKVGFAWENAVAWKEF
ncbi:putative amidase [Halenospora varia]|nr:putative amidase [Halenospora varia]